MIETKIIERDGLTLTESAHQSYTNMTLSVGMVTGHPVDTIYLRVECQKDWMLLLRPDEAMSLVWLLSGVCWSEAMSKMEGEK
jgi:hypothetical protein